MRPLCQQSTSTHFVVVLCIVSAIIYLARVLYFFHKLFFSHSSKCQNKFPHLFAGKENSARYTHESDVTELQDTTRIDIKAPYPREKGRLQGQSNGHTGAIRIINTHHGLIVSTLLQGLADWDSLSRCLLVYIERTYQL